MSEIVRVHHVISDDVGIVMALGVVYSTVLFDDDNVSTEVLTASLRRLASHAVSA